MKKMMVMVGSLDVHLTVLRVSLTALECAGTPVHGSRFRSVRDEDVLSTDNLPSTYLRRAPLTRRTPWHDRCSVRGVGIRGWLLDAGGDRDRLRQPRILRAVGGSQWRPLLRQPVAATTTVIVYASVLCRERERERERARTRCIERDKFKGEGGRKKEEEEEEEVDGGGGGVGSGGEQPASNEGTATKHQQQQQQQQQRRERGQRHCWTPMYLERASSTHLPKTWSPPPPSPSPSPSPPPPPALPPLANQPSSSTGFSESLGNRTPRVIGPDFSS
ncbi:hypothetical protein M0802_009417 [Mischocyttarus mexicanus]|nr:hypothetical protein M0802_009417 [Mischocyttarus mexicanus]